MATLRQQAAVKILSENIGKPIGRVLKQSGYSKSVSKSPQRVTETKGFQELAKEAGLTVDLLNNALVADIKAKPKKRTEELKLGYKVLGISEVQEKPGGDTYNTFIQQNTTNMNTPQAKELVEITLETLMERTKRKINGQRKTESPDAHPEPSDVGARLSADQRKPKTV